MPRLEKQLRYRALADIIVGGRTLFVKGAVFTMGEQFGDALVRGGKATQLAALEQDAPEPGRYKRRDMRAKGSE